jgi:Ser/Thr protein kinase RdoA (MazF antagonist)
LSEAVPVVKALPARDKRKAILLKQSGKQMVATVFEMAKGIPLTLDRLWEPDIIELWGATMGVLHKRSRSYKAGGYTHRNLNGEVLLDHAKKLIGQEHGVIELMEKKWNSIKNHEQIAGGWGMIHGDFTQANMHIFKGRLYPFDFDDCLYAPYVYDIAITFYVTFLGIWQHKDVAQNESFFIRHFINGYKRQNDVAIDINTIKLLMDYYNTLVYVRTSQVAVHPFKEYSLHQLKYGALAGLSEDIIFN